MANPNLALPALIAVDVWKTMPFVTLLLAALQTIPGDIYEAAKVDGASALRLFFCITMPLLTPGLLVTMIFRTLDALRVFDVIQVMKGTDLFTISMSVYNRQELLFGKLGYGSSISAMIYFITIFTFIYITTSRVKFD